MFISNDMIMGAEENGSISLSDEIFATLMMHNGYTGVHYSILFLCMFEMLLIFEMLVYALNIMFKVFSITEHVYNMVNINTKVTKW